MRYCLVKLEDDPKLFSNEQPISGFIVADNVDDVRQRALAAEEMEAYRALATDACPTEPGSHRLTTGIGF